MTINLKIAFIIAGFFFLSITAFAQSKSELLIGNWAFSKWENLNKNPNREIRFEKEANDKIVTFKKDNKCETTRIVGGKKEIVGSGSYKISEDGKYLIQDNQQFEIVSFEKDEFAIRVQADLIIHLKRVADIKQIQCQ